MGQKKKKVLLPPLPQPPHFHSHVGSEGNSTTARSLSLIFRTIKPRSTNLQFGTVTPKRGVQHQRFVVHTGVKQASNLMAKREKFFHGVRCTGHISSLCGLNQSNQVPINVIWCQSLDHLDLNCKSFINQAQFRFTPVTIPVKLKTLKCHLLSRAKFSPLKYNSQRN